MHGTYRQSLINNPEIMRKTMCTKSDLTPLPQHRLSNEESVSLNEKKTCMKSRDNASKEMATSPLPT